LSSQQSVQRQVIGQTNVKPTSEKHPGPKNRKNGERLTPIASDRPPEPVLRRWRGGGISMTMLRQVRQMETRFSRMMEGQKLFTFQHDILRMGGTHECQNKQAIENFRNGHHRLSRSHEDEPE